MGGPEPVVARPRAPRMPYWDNLRFVAIALVVVGHTISNVSRADTMTAAYFVIYAFHMPLFAFVSGHFARAEPITRAVAFTTVRQLVAPYLVFSVVWWLLRLAVEGRARLDLGSPYQLLWFLLALAVWRAALPYLAALRFPVLISIAVAVGAGYLNSVGTAWESGKILGMLPFFVLGWAARDRGWTSRERLQRLTDARLRVVAVIVIAVAALIAWVGVDAIRDLELRKWARMGANYADAGMPEWWAGGVRLGLLGLAVVLGLCVMSLVPTGRSPMTGWGARTMYVYLLHLFPLYLIGELTGLFDHVDSIPEFALLGVLGVVWTGVLSSGIVARVFRPVVEPRLAWLEAHSASAGAAVGTARPSTSRAS